MSHWKTFFDKQYVGAWDLNGRDAVVVISAVTKAKLRNGKNESSSKLIASLQGKEKKLALNITNCTTIAAMYGNEVKNWIGKTITIFPTTTTFGGSTVECVRVRPMDPKASSKPAEFRQGEPAYDAETGEVLDGAERETASAGPDADENDANEDMDGGANEPA